MDLAFPRAFAGAEPQISALAIASGLIQVRAVHDESAFGSAFIEYGDPVPALRLVYDGREGALFAEVFINQRWIDVESLPDGSPVPFDRNAGDARLADLVAAVRAALASRDSLRKRRN